MQRLFAMKNAKWFSKNKYQLLADHSLEEKLIPTVKIIPQLVTEPIRDGLRPEIQGLRAVAISAVLLFHMWSTIFSVGYLGVDCFFVISGYLMVMLMDRKQKLTLADSENFYYRRIKRIVPTYVFVITSTLIACYLLISEFEFDQIVSEATSSLFFYSNFPFAHKTSYFDSRSKYQFFLHTWSLSCELQFYLLVPLLMLIIGILTDIHFCSTVLFIFILCILSFCRQVTSTSNTKHMTLDGRIWQFLFGFFAHFVYKAKLLDWTSKPDQNICCKFFRWLRNVTPVVLIVCLLTFPMFDLLDQQIQRFLVAFLTALIISIRQDDSVLSGDTFINLGNISYSVYLVHWPTFTMHKFLDPDLYEDGKEINHMIGSYLIGLSILLGYLVEKGFKHLISFIKNWWSLVYLLFILYLAAGVSLACLHKNALKLIEDKPLTKAGEEKRLQDTLMLWESRKTNKLFSNTETMAFNSEIAYFYETCHNKTHKLASKLKDLSAFEKICHETGYGKKEIVVLGNSHAYKAFIGIAQIFKPLARRITLISTPACVPGSKEHQHHSLSKSKCEKFIENGVKVLQQYNHKIDIVISLFGWYKFLEYSKDESAKLKNEMQAFFGNLSEIASEVSFVPMMNLVFTKDPLRDVQKKLKSNQTIGQIGDTKTKILSNQLSIRHTLKQIECPKCLKIDFTDLWCDDFCSAIDKRHLIYFLDNHHCSTFGAMFIGDYLLTEYKKHVKQLI